MIPKGLFTQIALILLSVGIVMTYIQPTFERIGETQETTSEYDAAIDNVTRVNQRLSSLLATVSEVESNPTQYRKLQRYMPNEVDPIAVMRDLETIANNAGVIITNIEDGTMMNAREAENRNRRAVVDNEDEDEIKAYPYTFNLVVDGSYVQTKRLVEALESNDYPLEIHSLNITASDGGILTSDFRVVTYSHLSMEPDGNQ